MYGVTLVEHVIMYAIVLVEPIGCKILKSLVEIENKIRDKLNFQHAGNLSTGEYLVVEPEWESCYGFCDAELLECASILSISFFLRIQCLRD